VTAATESLAKRTVRGVFWAYGSYVGGRLLSLLATAILARLILPEDFGLVALTLIAMAFLDIFPGLGVGEALVIVDDAEIDEKAETAFVVQVVIGFALAALATAVAPAAASFFHQPGLVALMAVFGLNFVVTGFGATHAALAQRSLDFRSRTMAELADVTVRGGVAVGLALAGAGAWSLVIGYLVGSLAWTVTIWRRVRWRPRLRARRAHLRGLLSFGGTVTAVGIMGAFLTQFDNLVVGRVLGAADLGYYSMATRLPELFILSLAVVGGRVLYPALASLHLDDMGHAFLTALRYTSIVTLPLAVFLAILAQPLTTGLFGEQWRPAVSAAQVLSLWALASTLLFVCGSAFKARNRPDVLLELAVPQAVALVVGSLLVVDRGIVALAWVQAAIAIGATVCALAIAARMFGLTAHAVVAAMQPALLASSGLAAALVVGVRALSGFWPTLVGCTLGGAVVYVGLLLVLAPDVLDRLRALMPRHARPRLGLELDQL
jgi:O-antigen/teichoic acid export membrane protein